MQEKDRSRYNILIGRGNEIFERMENNISNFNSQNITFIGIILAILSIILILVLFLFQEGWQPSDVDIWLLLIFVSLSLISLIVNISIFHPTDYKDLNIFEQKRFSELKKMSEQTLLSDFLHHLKEAYEYNVNKYEKRMQWFTFALYSFIIANIVFIILIIKNIMLR